MSRKIGLTGLFLLCLFSLCYSQKGEKNKVPFVEAEYLFGKIIPNQIIKNFPKTGIQQGFVLNFGARSIDTTKWGRYYNFPETGIMLVYSNLGNNEVFGHMFNVLPYVSLDVFNKFRGKSTLKLGAGISYFNTSFDSIENPTNEIVGSNLTWDVKVFLYHQILQTNKFRLKAGIGFSHESNGHTKLPNRGVNSYLFSLSGQFYKNEIKSIELPQRLKGANHTSKKYFINMQQGYGFHEQDGSEGPQTGRSKPVYSASFAVGTVFNNHIKLRTGLVYRFYEQFNIHLKENDIEGLSDSPGLSSSNVILFVGNEFLMSHFAFDVRFGVNLYKPFYRRFNEETDIGTQLRKIFSSRVGANLYLKSTNLQPKNNFFIGAHINANMGKADFTEFSLGYVYTIN